MDDGIKVNNFDEMKQEIIDHVKKLKEQGSDVKVDEDQINDLINKIFSKTYGKYERKTYIESEIDKRIKRIAEEKSGYLDYKDFFKMYNYCTKDPYFFMTIDARPTATIQFKKNFHEPIDLSELNSLEHSSLECNFEKIFTNNDS